MVLIHAEDLEDDTEFNAMSPFICRSNSSDSIGSESDSDGDMPKLYCQSDTNDSKSNSDSDEVESQEDVALLNKRSNTIWIGDSGAS